MTSSNHRKSNTVIHAPPPKPRRAPFQPHSPPPATITIPISIGPVDESVHRTFGPPLRTSSRDVHENVCPTRCLSGRSTLCPDALESIDKVTHHHGKLAVGAVDISGRMIYSENFMETSNNSDSLTKDAENICKLLKAAKLEKEATVTSPEQSNRYGVDPSLREDFAEKESEDLISLSLDDPITPYDIQPQAFEALKMLYGQDSFHVSQNRAARRSKPSSRKASAIMDDELLSNKQLIAQMASESHSLEHIDRSSLEDSPHGTNIASSPRALVCSSQGVVRSESRNALCTHRTGPDSPVVVREPNGCVLSGLNSSPDSLPKQDVRSKPTCRRDRLIRSGSCDIIHDSSETLDISPLTEYPRKVKSARHAKSNARQLTQRSSEGRVTRHKVIPPPPPHPRNNPIPLPQLMAHPNPRKPHSESDTSSDEDDCCLPGSYADMMSLARRMSSSRSLGEPSVLKSPNDEQYWKSLRGRPKSKQQMRGRGQSAKRNRTCRDAYDSCGEMSGAETSHISQNSRKSTTKRLVPSRHRKIERERTNEERVQGNFKTVNVRRQRLDRLYSNRRHQRCKGNPNLPSAPIVKKNKFGIAGLFRKNKNRLSGLRRAGTGSTDNISGSLSTADSKSTRRSRQSWDGRKSFESGPSRKSTKSLLFSKRRIMDSSNILSAAADIFQHQCIQVNPNAFDDELSCDSSLSCYSEGTSDCVLIG